MHKDKFIVQHYFCNSESLTLEMNRMCNKNYYPKEIRLEPYQDKVEGFVIYELEEVESTLKIGYLDKE